MVSSVSEVIVIFLQLILFANTAAFYCSLLELVSHSLRRRTAVRNLARDGIVSKRSITHANFGLFQETMAYKPAFNAYNAILDSFFNPYSAIVDSFVIVSFFLEKHCIPQHYRSLTN